MTNFKQKLLAVTVALFLSGGAFAQRRGNDKQRPPKDDRPKVVVEPKEKPPQNRDNQNRNKGDKRNDGRRGRP